MCQQIENVFEESNENIEASNEDDVFTMQMMLTSLPSPNQASKGDIQEQYDEENDDLITDLPDLTKFDEEIQNCVRDADNMTYANLVLIDKTPSTESYNSSLRDQINFNTENLSDAAFKLDKLKITIGNNNKNLIINKKRN
jgi:hypothetical protein